MFEFFRNTLAPWQWALLALVPPAIIALYFLKLRRQPLEVPSTYLWKRTIEDLHVNSLWQRLRHNILLFLQLLLIALAMLALLRPGWQGTKLEGDRFIFLVDNSASMSATDAEGAKNRLEQAKTLVGGLIDQMESGMTAMIISFADTPQVVQEFTDNRRLLRERLATIQPTVRGTDLHGALDLADGLANPGRITTQEGGAEIDVVEPEPATLYIFSDGRFEDVKGFALGNLGGPNGLPVYVPIGSLEAQNLAITAFATGRSDAKPEERQAFVQVANLTDAAQSPVVELELNGSFLDAKQVEVPAGESSGAVFPLADATGKLTARLKYELNTPTKRDMLEQDDTAYAPLNDAKLGRVLLVTPANVPVQTSLATPRAGRLVTNVEIKSPDELTSDVYKREAEAGAYDLIVFDQCAPSTMPRANTIFIGRLPPTAEWHGVETAADAESAADAEAVAPPAPEVATLPQIIDWDRSHPLLSNVELGNVDVGDSIVLDPPTGTTVLIDSTAGPIAAIAPRDAYQDVVLGFEIVGKDKDGDIAYNTNWPRRLSFPTFWLNVLEYLAGGTQDSELASTRPGRPVELSPADNEKELIVVDPAGKQIRLQRSGEDVFQFHDTQLLGVYEVRRPEQGLEQKTERFAVNLFDRQESDVRLRPSQDAEGNTLRPDDIRIGNVDVAASVGRTPMRKEAWKIVLACALLVLVIEWYVYNRRIYM
jgi:hypothetical protein